LGAFVPLSTSSEEETRRVGQALAATLAPGDLVSLTGDLGAGKTTLVQGIAQGLGAEEHVTSPTFTLVREYVTGRLPIAHVDVYRLDRIQDVVDLALDELEDGACVLIVEWGDAVQELLPHDRLALEMRTADPTGEDETRTIEVRAEGRTWEERAHELTGALRPWGGGA
jgi:tRNA threonylcarbamoyladenosine biosynthesis protein TsaE